MLATNCTNRIFWRGPNAASILTLRHQATWTWGPFFSVWESPPHLSCLLPSSPSFLLSIDKRSRRTSSLPDPVRCFHISFHQSTRFYFVFPMKTSLSMMMRKSPESSAIPTASWSSPIKAHSLTREVPLQSFPGNSPAILWVLHNLPF